MENNKGFIAKIGNVNAIEGADRIKSADVMLNGVKQTQVIVGLDLKENTLVAYFDSNICLSEKIMVDYPDIVKYLAKAGRVKTIKLKGVISSGLVMEMDKFLPYFKDEKEMNKVMVEGYAFTKIGDTEICHKYTPAPCRNSGDGNHRKGMKKEPSRMVEGIFKFHFDTSQLLRNVGRLNPDSIISVSRKVHGTSAICGNTMVKRKLSIIDKLAMLFGAKINKYDYDYIYASRNTVKNARYMKDTDLNKNDLWIAAGQKYFLNKLHKGETVYYEIVGYMSSGRMVQKNYDYGCPVGEYKVAVYRITNTNMDGVPHEMSWMAMKDRCKELGVPMVEEFYYGKAKLMFYEPSVEPKPLTLAESLDLLKLIEDANNNPMPATLTPPEVTTEYLNREWAKNFVNKLKEVYLEKDCWDSLLSKKMPDEGIVLRVEGLSIDVFKLKSEKFLLGESKAKEDGEEDLEESESSNTEENETKGGE